MKRILLFAGILAGLWGCDRWDSDRTTDRLRADAWGDRDGRRETAARDSSVLWISGVEFPTGYDWQRDTAYGTVDARLVLLRGGKRVLEIPAGDRFQVSTDPDMHRIAGGRLFTDYSTEDETVIACDGKEVFRYPGREMIAGFLLRGTDIWTLGLDRVTGRGISLRRNGTEVFSDPQGQLPGGHDNTAYEGGLLHEADGALWFFYYQATRTDAGQVRTWYRVRDGVPEPLTLPQGITVLHDIRQVGSQTVLAAEMKALDMPLVAWQGSRSQAFRLDGATGSRNYRIVPTGGEDFCLKGEMLLGQSAVPAVWNKSGEQLSVSWNMKALDFYMEDGHVAYVGAGSDGIPVCYGTDGNDTVLAERNHFISPRCGLLHDGVFYLALTPCDRKKPPFLLRNGQVETIRINGYVTGLAITD